MKYTYDDGGRAAAGFKGQAGDCVARAVAIATGLPYATVYSALSRGMGEQRKSKGATARNGVSTGRKWFKDYMRSLGFSWTPTMSIGSGTKVHLHEGELPEKGRLVVRVSRHVCALIDGTIRDTYDPRREIHEATFAPGANSDHPSVRHHIRRRAVYGYWTLKEQDDPEGEGLARIHSRMGRKWKIS